MQRYVMSKWAAILAAAIGLAAIFLCLPASPQQVTTTAPTTTPALTYSQLATTTSAAAGFASIVGPAQTVVVSTSVVTANSQIFLQYDETTGSSCTSGATNTENNRYWVSMRSAGTSFTIKAYAAIATGNTACLSYFIVN